MKYLLPYIPHTYTCVFVMVLTSITLQECEVLVRFCMAQILALSQLRNSSIISSWPIPGPVTWDILSLKQNISSVAHHSGWPIIVQA